MASISTVDVEKAIKNLKRKFWWFSLIASLNHALNYVVNSFATSVLSHKLGGIILGLSWTLNAVSGLTIATPIVLGLGFKKAMILSLWGYAIQIATLYWAVVTPDINQAWIVAIAGSSVAGITSAVWWTAQGVYFEEICRAIDAVYLSGQFDKQSILESVRADLSAHWTIIYQSADIFVFLTLSAFPLAIGAPISTVLLALVFLGLLTSLLGYTFESVKAHDDKVISWSELYDAVVAVPKQVRDDSRVSLLAPFVFGFGITTAMFGYYVNADIVSDSNSLGTQALGFLEAWSYFIAVVSAYPYAYVANNYKGGQDWVIQFGSLAFLTCGILVLSIPLDDLGTWAVMLVVKGMYGLGRGVFEGSCRAVYASMFAGKDLSTAFSGQTLSAGFSGGICFFLFGVLTRQSIALVTIVNGLVAISCYFVLMYGVDPYSPVSWSTLCSYRCTNKGSQNRQSGSSDYYTQLNG
ncbi:hypothetical protein EON65_04150 [archaeon]|nr:MAG: hypothetical protein EON65_04150 [archaeon]